MRINHYKGTNILAKAAASILSDAPEAVKAAITGAKHGDMESSNHDKALRLEA